MQDKILEIRENIELIIESDSQKTIKELNLIKEITIEENDIVNIILDGDIKVNKDSLRKQIARIIKLNLGYPGLKVVFKDSQMEKLEERKQSKTRYIGILSGKGGVGKSNVCANLAIALRDLGYKVGIIDADIYGSSIPNIFNLRNVEVLGNADNKIFPIIKENIEIISTEFFNEDNKPIVWRGPMLAKMLNHFFNDVLWSEDLDFMLIDLPPGTGDVLIDFSKFVPESEMILVTTPHINASTVAIKAGIMMNNLNHKIIGVVENMSYYLNPINNEKDYVFGFGGVNDIKNKLNTVCLAQIPLERPTGQYLSIYDKKDRNYQVYQELAKKIL